MRNAGAFSDWKPPRAGDGEGRARDNSDNDNTAHEHLREGSALRRLGRNEAREAGGGGEPMLEETVSEQDGGGGGGGGAEGKQQKKPPAHSRGGFACVLLDKTYNVAFRLEPMRNQVCA